SHALLGKRIGRRALLYGAIVGNIPDLDILANPWLDPLQRLQSHRGLSHSLPVLAAASPPLASLLKKLDPTTRPIPSTLLTLTLFLILATHALLDACTVYGTLLLAPFSNHRFSWNLIFIIDPIFTLPLLAATILALWLPPPRKITSLAPKIALLIGTLYLLNLHLIKSHIQTRFERAHLTQNLITLSPPFTAPTFPGPLLWRQIIRAPEGCYIAYASLLDPPSLRITHTLLPFPLALQEQWQHHPAIQKLQWFAQHHGYLSADPDSPTSPPALIFHDLRFGEIRTDPLATLTPENTFAIFRWRFIPRPDGTFKLHTLRPTIPPRHAFPILWQRLLGQPVL
ncbi:MAG: metal-dependent hydrolase, partial [Methylacidiphilales bacterium]|nr:metal-dependent hydrolase [Candidatus Methylacidiphilales bacterium]